jgi:hypothetical protein
MGQLWGIMRLAALGGLLFIAADHWRHGNVSMAEMVLVIAVLVAR